MHHLVHRSNANAYLTLGGYLTLSLQLWFLGLDRVARRHVTGFQQEIAGVLTGGPDLTRPLGR